MQVGATFDAALISTTQQDARSRHYRLSNHIAYPNTTELSNHIVYPNNEKTE